ncbi:MAG: ATP-binding cassette domain-containing protein [Candidatus Izemoplasma sp.]|nr:ATP-binding cassette domain-containing protein [Candidatus Izemoplasma sp.]
MSILHIENLHKTYKNGTTKTHVLKGIDLDIEEGSFVSILGRSGSGKTTLLNVISTLLDFDKGTIIIDGEDVQKAKNKKLNSIRNNYIGFVFQDFNLVNEMSILDNVATPLILNGVAFRKAREKAKEALEDVGLGQYTKVRPPELSGGQQQRVAIARAIVNDQKILLCDEPTGALDDYTATEILNILKRLSKTKTVIMVTHDEEFAKKYSDRLIMLVDGKIVKDYTTEDGKLFNAEIVEDRALRIRSAGFLNLLMYSFLSMDIDKKKFGKTFKTFSLSLTLFIVISIINENLDVFTERYLDFFVTREVANTNVLLDFVYQFFEQNVTVLVQTILFILIGFCVVSYLFVFTINIINKKREIAVLKAFGASQEAIAILFMLRPIKFTLAIFKDTLIYTVILMLLVNGILNFRALFYTEYLSFVANIFIVSFNLIKAFVINSTTPIDFPLLLKHIYPIFLLVLGLFMIGSLLPAYYISKSDTIRMLAKE